MMLQLAIGPICIFIFQIASLRGFFAAETGVLGVTLIDGLFIVAAILGIATVMEKQNMRWGLKLFGAAVLVMFGLNLMLSLLDIRLLPGLSIADFGDTTNAFVYALLLTVSNPLTVIFWAGVLSTKVAEENMARKDIYVFGFGAWFAAVFFLTLVAGMGSLTREFISPFVLQVLNLFVGAAFIYFALKMVLQKKD
ncbi:LysE family translocator [Paenibacillus oleatilyticus]|uniref:LysE family translocator n=1 Tax=Paenibacillus oleatilyticus TaxID=2594886 RepID=UPI001C1F9F56|nr:LysE family transporter [Paenibacillus oleatilyticus]MBU7319532.1 LysE family translocator [Paenibacillus oleatilyticus]